jgi:hypothetical protein
MKSICTASNGNTTWPTSVRRRTPARINVVNDTTKAAGIVLHDRLVIGKTGHSGFKATGLL